MRKSPCKTLNEKTQNTLTINYVLTFILILEKHSVDCYIRNDKRNDNFDGQMPNLVLELTLHVGGGHMLQSEQDEGAFI